MPWSGYLETMVTQLTYTEWVFSLRARREVQIGYSIRVADWWELFGNDHWVWFTGAVASFRGAIQIVSQWAERESLGPRDRVWQWVHWKNPTNDDVIVKPYLLLAPPLEGGWLAQSRATTARRTIWTIVDRVTEGIAAAGSILPGPGGDSGGGGGGRGGRNGQGLELTVAPRSLEGQTMRKVELKGDLRYVPVEELWGRLDQLGVPALGAGHPAKPASRQAPGSGSPSAMTDGAPRRQAVTEHDGDNGWRAAVGRLEAAMNSLMSGDARAIKALYSHRDDVTAFFGWGGYEKGWAAVSRRWDWAAEQFQGGGPVTYEHLTAVTAPGLATTTHIETTRVRLAGTDQPTEWSNRVTHVFRLEDGEWRLVHRHANRLEPRYEPGARHR